MPDGRGGPAFLMTQQLLRAQALQQRRQIRAGSRPARRRDRRLGNGLVRDWNRPFTKLSFAEKQELQQRLTAHGYYDGKADGKIGEGSRSAIKAFQAQSGLTQDGHPSMEVLKALRANRAVADVAMAVGGGV